MDGNVIATIISLTVAVASPVVKFLIDERPFRNAPTQRLKAVSRKWSGIVIQPDGPEGILKLTISLHIKSGFFKVYGKGDFQYDGKTYYLNFKGRPMHSDYFLITYYDVDRNLTRYGTFILKLSGDGKILEGKFVAYAGEMEKIVDGSITLRPV